MGIQVAKDENQWVDLAWEWLQTHVQPRERVFLPAGNTPRPLYRRWQRARSQQMETLKLVQIDEILSGPARGSFRDFFSKEMPSSLGQFEWIDDGARGADVAVLGVGINGHVGFHEPFLPKDFYSGCVSLAAETLRQLNLAEPTWAITYGVAAFWGCEKILVLARGEEKRSVMETALRNKSLPIGWLMGHRNITLLTDFELSL